ncbi:MAG: phosphoenolpyruvate--protein phosphotransferase [Chlamydiales bacterium]
MKVKLQETRLSGNPISHGVAIGTPFFFTVVEDAIPEVMIADEGLESEIERYRHAVSRCKQDVIRLQKQLEDESAIEAVAILDTHLQIMHDPLLTLEIENEILKQKKNADFIFRRMTLEYQKKFEMMSDAFFKERALDLQDIARRIVAYLCEEHHTTLKDIPENTIVFARELAASDVAEADIKRVIAFVTDAGGMTSHAAIVAKAKGIPYIANIDFGVMEQIQFSSVIVDGDLGEVILNPEKETLDKYRKYQKFQNKYFKNLEKISKFPAVTQDGYSIRLSANIEIVNEIDKVHRYGGIGVGLFRSEYIFLARQNFPSEEEQFSIYRAIVKKMRGLPIVIRTFDVGGDKLSLPYHSLYKGNPYLGCRAIRFLLQEKEIFKTQLRAILRASVFGNVKVLFPMVSGLPELREAKKIVAEVHQELLNEHIKVADHIPIGCMVEVPSAAIISDLLASECDFLSIGTNDLIQYALAADRGNEAHSVQYAPTHPAMIRLIQLVVNQASAKSVPVTVCGEIAGDPCFTALLVGLGVKELSVTSRFLPIIKHAIRKTIYSEAVNLAENALKLSTSEDIEQLIKAYYEKISTP